MLRGKNDICYYRIDVKGRIKLACKNHTLGGLNGYSVENCIERKKTPPTYGVSSGPIMVACQFCQFLHVLKKRV